MSEIKNPEAESYELLQKYGDSIQDYLKDWVVGKKLPTILFELKESKDETQKMTDQLQNVIINSLEYNEKENVFSFKVGREKVFIAGEAADMIKQGYKSER